MDVRRGLQEDVAQHTLSCRCELKKEEGDTGVITTDRVKGAFGRPDAEFFGGSVVRRADIP